MAKPLSVHQAGTSEAMPEIHVGIADYAVVRAPHRLITLGLGSCVGVVVYDEGLHVGGLVHIMLPCSKGFPLTKPAKFADTGIPLLVNQVVRRGGRLKFLKAKMAGGAQMFFGHGNQDILAVGERNIKAVREVLHNIGISVTGADVGGSKGRTLVYDAATGVTMVRSFGGTVSTI